MIACMVGQFPLQPCHAKIQFSSRCKVVTSKPGLHVVEVGFYLLSCAISWAVAATTSAAPVGTTESMAWSEPSSDNGGLIALGTCVAFIFAGVGLGYYIWKRKQRKANEQEIKVAVMQDQRQQSQQPLQCAASPELQKYVRNTLVDKRFPMGFLLKPPRAISEGQAAALRLAAAELLARFPEYSSEPELVLCFDDGVRSADESSCGPGTFFAASIIKHLWENDMPCVSKLMVQCEQEVENPWFCQADVAPQPTYKSWFKTCSVVIVVETVSLYISVECLQEIFMAIECKAVVVVLRFEDCLPEADCQWPTVLIGSEEQAMKDAVQKCLFGIKPIPAPPATIPANTYHLNSVRQAIEIHVPRKPIDWANCKTTRQMMTATEKGRAAANAAMVIQKMKKKTSLVDAKRQPKLPQPPVKTGPKLKLEKNATKQQLEAAKLEEPDRNVKAKTSLQPKLAKSLTKQRLESAKPKDPDQNPMVQNSPRPQLEKKHTKQRLKDAKSECPDQIKLVTSIQSKLDATKQQLDVVSGDSDQSQMAEKGRTLKPEKQNLEPELSEAKSVPSPSQKLPSESNPGIAISLSELPPALAGSKNASPEKPMVKKKHRLKPDRAIKGTRARPSQDTNYLHGSASSGKKGSKNADDNAQQHLLAATESVLDQNMQSRRGSIKAVASGILRSLSQKAHASVDSADSQSRSLDASVVGREA